MAFEEQNTLYFRSNSIEQRIKGIFRIIESDDYVFVIVWVQALQFDIGQVRKPTCKEMLTAIQGRAAHGMSDKSTRRASPIGPRGKP